MKLSYLVSLILTILTFPGAGALLRTYQTTDLFQVNCVGTRIKVVDVLVIETLLWVKFFIFFGNYTYIKAGNNITFTTRRELHETQNDLLEQVDHSVRQLDRLVNATSQNDGEMAPSQNLTIAVRKEILKLRGEIVEQLDRPIEATLPSHNEVEEEDGVDHAISSAQYERQLGTLVRSCPATCTSTQWCAYSGCATKDSGKKRRMLRGQRDLGTLQFDLEGCVAAMNLDLLGLLTLVGEILTAKIVVNPKV